MKQKDENEYDDVAELEPELEPDPEPETVPVATTLPNGEIKCLDPNFPRDIWAKWGSGRRETYNKIYMTTKGGSA